MAISLRNHSVGKRTAARSLQPFEKITAVLDVVPVSVWLLAAADGTVLYANPHAMTVGGWRGVKRRPLQLLSKIVSLRNRSASDGIVLADLNRMSRAHKPASTYHATLKAKSGPTRAVVLRATSLATAEYGRLLLLSAEAPVSPSPRSAPRTTRWELAVAHDLNNIGASLLGFVELASEANPGNVAVNLYIDEFRLVYSRLARVAGALELLAETRVPRKSMTIRSIPALQPLKAGAAYAIHLQCDPRLRLTVNVEFLQRTLQGLAALARSTGAEAAVTYDVNRTDAATTCSACDAAVASGAVRIGANIGRTARDVYWDAVIHGAHLAGGHVRWRTNRENCSVLLPVAK